MCELGLGWYHLFIQCGADTCRLLVFQQYQQLGYQDLLQFSQYPFMIFVEFLECDLFAGLGILIFLGTGKQFLSMTVPSSEGGVFRDASFTSPALSPKMAGAVFLPVSGRSLLSG